MKRTLLAGLTCLFGAASLLAEIQPLQEAQKVRLGTRTFLLPRGFTIEQVAGPPLVLRPIHIAFDPQGRLYVTESSGASEPVAVQLQKKPHRLLRLEDRDGDGRFERGTVFAEHLMFPEGVCWYREAVYVAAVPAIWRFRDTTGAGRADQREVWFDGKTVTGCANDLHGPFVGPDGWFYWCKGAFARQTYSRPGKEPLRTRAAHIFRARPDGRDLEPVMTGGMDNPVAVVWLADGERIFTTTFLQFPGGGRRDGLLHDVYGGLYGKVWEVLDEHPWTGPQVLPVLSHLGPAAPCGLTRYRSAVFGAEYQDNLFACLFNLHKVTRHVLTPQGATFRCRDEDFLVCNDPDFHPTDVAEDADGSLLVVDTGGWYRLCCPSSQLYKPEALGAIYRIRRQGACAPADPRGQQLAWERLSSEELASLLADARPAVRQQAQEALAERGPAALPALTRLMATAAAPVRRRVVWTAAHLEGAAAQALVRRALADDAESVRQVAGHVTALWRDRQALPALKALLAGPSRANRRVAAEALGRLGDPTAVPALLAALRDDNDPFLNHSLIFALIEIGDVASLRSALKHPAAAVRRGALIALEQLRQAPREAVLGELSASWGALREAAWWIASRHPEWGPDLAVWCRQRLRAPVPPGERVALQELLARLAQAPAIQELLAQELSQGTPEEQRFLLEVLPQTSLRQIPASWRTALEQLLTSRQLLAQSLAALEQLPLQPADRQALAPVLEALGQDEHLPDRVRLQALALLPERPAPLSPALFAWLCRQVVVTQPPAQRRLAAEALARHRWSAAQQQALIALLPQVGPLEINRLLEALRGLSSEALGQQLLQVLQTAPARGSLRPDVLRRCLASLPASLQTQAQMLLASPSDDPAEQRARLERLRRWLPRGDAHRGHLLFNSPKAACSSCHAIGYVGGTVGPDLTHIGRIRSEQDLLEAIVFPSASFAPGYEPVQVTLRDGKSYNGLLRQQRAEEIVLLLGPNQEVHLRRADIEDLQPSRVSIMPAGLDQLLTPQEVADLVAFLKMCR